MPTDSTTSDLTTMTAEQLLDQALKESYRRVYGQVFYLEPSLMVFQKGAPGGRVPFDPTIHRRDQAVLVIDIRFEPLPQPNRQSYTIERSFAVQSKEGKIARDSLLALGLDFRKALNAYFEIELVVVRSYVNANGEEKQATAIKFLKHFADEAACRRAYNERWGESGEDGVDQTEAPASGAAEKPAETPAPAPTPAEDGAKTIMLRLLSGLWTAAGNDEAKFASLFGLNPWLVERTTLEEALKCVRPF